MREIVADKRRAVEAAPRDGTAWGELGMAFDAHERHAEAITCYQAAAEFAPDDARWPFLLGEEYRSRYPEAFNPKEAIRWYRLAVARRSPTPAHRATAELTLADVLAEQGQTAEAEDLYQRVYAADRTNAWAAFRVGTAAAERSETNAAIQILTKLARNPYAQKKAASTLAALHRQAGKTKDAEGFEYAASLLPEDRPWPNPFEEEMAGYLRGRQALFDAVTRAEERNDYKAAAEAARRFNDLYPSPESDLVLGRTLVESGDPETAIPILEDALARDPNLIMARAFLGMAWFHRGERADAAGHRSEAEGHYLKAVAALGRAVELKPDYAPGYLYQARALARLNRLPEAITAARAAVTRRPDEWEAHLVLGEVLAAAGQTQAAVEELEQAVKSAHPKEPRPRQALERLKSKK
jgi:tetratricopeptide (TPR) repeat protein